MITLIISNLCYLKLDYPKILIIQTWSHILRIFVIENVGTQTTSFLPTNHGVRVGVRVRGLLISEKIWKTCWKFVLENTINYKFISLYSKLLRTSQNCTRIEINHCCCQVCWGAPKWAIVHKHKLLFFAVE